MGAIPKYISLNIKTLRELEKWSGIKKGEIGFWKEQDRSRTSVTVVSNKKINGKERPITKIVDLRFKRLLQTLDKYLKQVHLPSELYGGVKGKDALSAARLHVGSYTLYKFDIKDFFPSVTRLMVKKLFHQIGCSEHVANSLSHILTLRGMLPQGYPTSTTVANLVLAVFCFGEIRRIVGTNNVTTVWIDDINISSPTKLTIEQRRKIVGVLIRWGFRSNRKKEKVISPIGRRVVNGYTVGLDKINIPRRKIRQIRQEVYINKKFGADEAMKKFSPDKLARLKNKGATKETIEDAEKDRIKGLLNYVDRSNKN